jgi:hypothetical protein
MDLFLIARLVVLLHVLRAACWLRVGSGYSTLQCLQT